MPQARGAATWLTNVRQAPPTCRVWIDQSEQHIENILVEDEMRRKIDMLSLRQHRSLADTQFELQEARRLVSDYTRMRELLKHNSLDSVMRRRPSAIPERMNSETPRRALLLLSAGRATPSSSAPARGGQQVAEKPRALSRGFSCVSVEEDSDVEEDPLFQSRTGLTISVRTPTPARLLPVATTSVKLGIARRPKTSHTQGRPALEIRKSLQLELDDSRDKAVRPLTSIGMVKGYDGTDTDGEETNIEGRSFQELKKMSHIDKLVSAEKEAQRAKLQEEFRKRRESDATLLQCKINSFYKRVDDLKKKSNKTVFNSFL